MIKTKRRITEYKSKDKKRRITTKTRNRIAK